MRHIKITSNCYTPILLNILEVLISKICLILIHFLILSQILLTFVPLKNILNSTANLEGNSIIDIESEMNNGTIRLNAIGPTQSLFSLNVFINGDLAFSINNNADKNVVVKDGDIIQVQGVNLKNYVKLNITESSNNIFLLNSKKTILVKNDIEYVCKIKLK